MILDGFRFDHTGLQHRKKDGPNEPDQWRPHGGGGYFNFRQNSHIYQMEKGRVHSGLTRVVWELNAVTKKSGGTRFMSGSHKAAFLPPAELMEVDAEMFEVFECPAGSCIVFTEALCHSAHPWMDEVDRMALFTCCASSTTFGSVCGTFIS